MSDHLNLVGTYNIRDLGGYPVNWGTTRQRVFIRAGNLDQLPLSSQQQLVDYGVKTVIDLRDEWEVQHYPNVFAQSQAVTYVNVPLLGNHLNSDDVWKAETENFQHLYELYGRYLDHCQTQIRTIISTIAENNPAALFHCYAGKDRTGIIAALLLGLAGVPDQIIAYDYAQSKPQIEHLIAEWRNYAVQYGKDMKNFDRDVASEETTMLAMLDHLKHRYGGVTGYLQTCGITDRQLTHLQLLLVQPPPE